MTCAVRSIARRSTLPDSSASAGDLSRLEKRSDMLLSTLRGYVDAMGGELDLVAKFPDRPAVRLKALAPTVAQTEADGGKASRAASRIRPRAPLPDTSAGSKQQIVTMPQLELTVTEGIE